MRCFGIILKLLSALVTLDITQAAQGGQLDYVDRDADYSLDDPLRSRDQIGSTFDEVEASFHSNGARRLSTVPCTRNKQFFISKNQLGECSVCSCYDEGDLTFSALCVACNQCNDNRRPPNPQNQTVTELPFFPSTPPEPLDVGSCTPFQEDIQFPHPFDHCKECICSKSMITGRLEINCLVLPFCDSSQQTKQDERTTWTPVVEIITEKTEPTNKIVLEFITNLQNKTPDGISIEKIDNINLPGQIQIPNISDLYPYVKPTTPLYNPTTSNPNSVRPYRPDIIESQTIPGEEETQSIVEILANSDRIFEEIPGIKHERKTCRPLPSNQPFAHPSDVCQICRCRERINVDYSAEVEIICRQRLVCCLLTRSFNGSYQLNKVEVSQLVMKFEKFMQASNLDYPSSSNTNRLPGLISPQFSSTPTPNPYLETFEPYDLSKHIENSFMKIKNAEDPKGYDLVDPGMPDKNAKESHDFTDKNGHLQLELAQGKNANGQYNNDNGDIVFFDRICKQHPPYKEFSHDCKICKCGLLNKFVLMECRLDPLCGAGGSLLREGRNDSKNSFERSLDLEARKYSKRKDNKEDEADEKLKRIIADLEAPPIDV